METSCTDPTAADLQSGLNRKLTFLIRRAHQIASQHFSEACLEIRLTPTQYAILFALRELGPTGQNELGRLAMLDRCTTSLVVRALLDRGLLIRTGYPGDRRKTLVSLSDAGVLLLARAEKMKAESSRAMLSVFDEAQASSFLDLLRIFTETHAERYMPAGSIR